MNEKLLGNGKQTKNQARVISYVLYTVDGCISLYNHTSFHAWLEDHEAFYVENLAAWEANFVSFTVRKEKRGGVDYWYAYSRVLGKLHKRFVGQTMDVTYRQLVKVARNMPTTKVNRG